MTSAIGDAKGVDVNTASREQLAHICGLGQDQVGQIVRNRPFSSWSDLKQVVGNKLVQDLQDRGATLSGNR